MSRPESISAAPMPLSPRPFLRRLAVLPLAALLALAACDSGSDAGARIAGRYTGVRGPGVPPQAVTYDATLTEAADGSVLGSGTEFNEKATRVVRLEGERVGDRVRLEIRRPEFPLLQPDSLVATVSADAGRLSGVLSGRSYGPGVTVPFTFTRTPTAP